MAPSAAVLVLLRAVWPASACVTSGLNMYEQVGAIRPFVSDRHDYDGNAQPPTPTLRTRPAPSADAPIPSHLNTLKSEARARAHERLAGVATQASRWAAAVRSTSRRTSGSPTRSGCACTCAGPAPPSARRRAVGGLCRCCNGEVATTRSQRGCDEEVATRRLQPGGCNEEVATRRLQRGATLHLCQLAPRGGRCRPRRTTRASPWARC